MTIAETIGAQFNDDYTVVENDNGKWIDQTCYEQATETMSNDSGNERYTFEDESIITITGHGWGYGCPHCYCWQPNHERECKESG